MDINATAVEVVDTTESTRSGLARAEGLWLNDCGLILQAESTLFRVSGDLLARQSPVFRDLFCPPPPPDADMTNGAVDVTVFLKALIYYDFFEPYPAPTTHSVLLGVLRLSHKYEVKALRKRALGHISAFHPTTLSEYEALASGGKFPHWYEELHKSGDFSTVVTLAREVCIDWILPVAFSRVCEFTPIEVIITGEMELPDKISVMDACRTLEAHRNGVTGRELSVDKKARHKPMPSMAPPNIEEETDHRRESFAGLVRYAKILH
ncbi:hypothetical protein B0H16DRAFT_1732543 [Mycena metata]|uniref:BTB domain-containing protein n=1 Tax=Mycena metata TaxID=1033252 RepID=A0AAD7I1R6_9AGAR|nr:hypothetical protein B0H16DRAFT_1732543 [Mycena metata]